MLEPQSQPVNALTVDVEDWHQLAHRWVSGQSVPPSRQVVKNTHQILDILDEHNVRATFFVLGMVAERFPELVRRIHAEGHEVATHGYAHRRVHDMGPEAFGADLRRSIRILEAITQEPVWGHRAAHFSIEHRMLWAWETIVAAGLRYDSSIFPIRYPGRGEPKAPRHPYKIHTPTGTVVEFPLATASLLGQNLPIAGGSYLRLVPAGLVRWAIRALNRGGQMAVLYVHSYEFEEGSLTLPVHAYPRRKPFYRSAQTLKFGWGRGARQQNKLTALLKSFPFAPLCEIYSDGEEGKSSGIL